MIKLSFVCGGSLRRVIINKRKIGLATQETGFVPITMDLDKIEDQKIKIKKKLGNEGVGMMKEIAKLKNEDAMAKDIIKDFQKSGWRLIKREDGIT